MKTLHICTSLGAVALLATVAGAGAHSIQADPDSLAGEVDRLFEGWIDAQSPGVAVAVIHDGETILERCYGLADLEHDLPITPSTVFNIGSISKQFTAFVIAMRVLLRLGQGIIC